MDNGGTSYVTAPNLRREAGDGVEYAYRDLGSGRPLVLFQHFRGNLDNWDPPLIDGLAQSRRVITVDYQGVGGSSGVPATPSTKWRARCWRSSPRSSWSHLIFWASASAAWSLSE